MTLFEEADKKVVIVSPYFKIRGWGKLIKRINNLQERNIDIEIYVREDQPQSIQEALNVGLSPITIPNLHTKIYLNEREGIVSSMNLLLSSDTNSIDIGYKTESKEEFDELKDYYERYIKRESEIANEVVGDWNEYLSELVIEKTKHNYARVFQEKQELVVNANNRYMIRINNDNGNYLQMVGILSGGEYEMLVEKPRLLRKTRFETELVEGGNGRYNLLVGFSEKILSKSIFKLNKNEEQKIAEYISDFIVFVENLKSKNSAL